MITRFPQHQIPSYDKRKYVQICLKHTKKRERERDTQGHQDLTILLFHRIHVRLSAVWTHPSGVRDRERKRKTEKGRERERVLLARAKMSITGYFTKETGIPHVDM